MKGTTASTVYLHVASGKSKTRRNCDTEYEEKINKTITLYTYTQQKDKRKI